MYVYIYLFYVIIYIYCFVSVNHILYILWFEAHKMPAVNLLFALDSCSLLISSGKQVAAHLMSFCVDVFF